MQTDEDKEKPKVDFENGDYTSYRQINIWCRPLKRSVYSVNELRTAVIKDDAGGSSLLLKEFREKERRKAEASGVLGGKRAHDSAYDEYTSALSKDSESYIAISGETPEEAVQEQPQTGKGLTRLRDRISNAVFDYSEIEQEKIEQEIDALVNADGYYNEVEPVDINDTYQEERPVNKPLIIAVVLLIIYIIVIIKF